MKFCFKYDNIVIGNDLKAIYFAFKEGYPVIFQELTKPYANDFLPTGESKKQLMEDYIGFLSLAGKVPFSNKIENIRVEENNKVHVSGKGWTAEITVQNKIYDFMSEVDENSDIYRVVDSINVRACSKHNFREIIDPNENFVKKIRFYPSQRADSSKLFDVIRPNIKPKEGRTFFDIVKDIESISYLTKNQLYDDGYSPTYSVLKTKDMMTKNGILGKKHGFERREYRTDFGVQRYKSIILEFTKREIFKIEEEKDYDLTSKDFYIRRLVRYIWTKNKKNKRISQPSVISTLQE